MSSFDNDLFNDDPNDSDLIKSLRKALKDAAKTIKEKDDVLSGYSKKERAASLADVLREKGLDNPKVTKLYPADADTTPEAVDAWLTEFGDLFGINRQESVADTETQAAARQITNASANAPAGNASFDVSALVAEIQNAKNDTELAAAYAKAGMK